MCVYYTSVHTELIRCYAACRRCRRVLVCVQTALSRWTVSVDVHVFNFFPSFSVPGTYSDTKTQRVKIPNSIVIVVIVSNSPRPGRLARAGGEPGIWRSKRHVKKINFPAGREKNEWSKLSSSFVDIYFFKQPSKVVFTVTVGTLDHVLCARSCLHFIVLRWIPVASGDPQERPAGERVRLRRHTDRFVTRAHGRPLRQNVSTYLAFVHSC